MTYAKHVRKPSTTKTPQTMPIPGKNMVKNQAGGFAFKADDWRRLYRFLMLGSEGGTYYEGEKKLTLANAAVVSRCLDEDAGLTLSAVVAVSDGGLAPSNSPAIFALALAAAHTREDVRRAAFQALPLVCRIGTHLFEFMDVYTALRGSKTLGRMARKYIGEWYTSKEAQNLAYGLIKYQQREGWSNRDVLRLAHPNPANPDQDWMFKWVTKGLANLNQSDIGDTSPLRTIQAFEAAKDANKQGVVTLIRDYNLPREAIPTAMLNDRDVWIALVAKMGYTAMLRNLPKMTELGLFDAFSPQKSGIIARLVNHDQIKKARVHPLQILIALKTYQSGVSVRGSKTWTPNGDIVSALNDAFYAAFDNIEPIEQNILVAIDCSGSMTSQVAGVYGLSAREAALAMALCYKKANPNTHVIAFSSHLSEVPWLTAGMRLDEAWRLFDRHVIAAGTNMNLPFDYVQRNNLPVDGVLMITDSEGWQGNQHPSQSRKLARPTKWALVQTTSTGTMMQDPNDEDAFEFAGFSANMFGICNEFFAGRL